MTIFVVTPFDGAEPLKAKMEEAFPGKYYALPSGGFLVSTEGTSKSVGEILGLEDNRTGLGRVMVNSISGYWGYGPMDMWEWLRLHWGTPQ